MLYKMGIFLLNIGPKADGTIPEQDRYPYEIGDWLAVNERPFIRAALGVIGRTDQRPERFPSRKRHCTNQDFATLREGLLYAIQLEPSGRTKELTCRLTMIQATENPSCAYSAGSSPWRESQLFLGVKIWADSTFSY